jgi:hypothetical protein
MMRCILKNCWFCLFLVLSIAPPASAGPYPPAAGQPGSDAISYTDPRFVEWASGYLNYEQGATTSSNWITIPRRLWGLRKGQFTM